MLELLTSGIHSSLQDLGRPGYRRYGVPVGGAMDGLSAINTNRLLGNPDDSLLLEMMYTGPQLLVKTDCVLAVQGSMQVKLDDHIIPREQTFKASKGSRISFVPGSQGVYTYLGIEGGFRAELVLGSGAGLAGTNGPGRLVKGDLLQAAQMLEPSKHGSPLLPTSNPDQGVIHVYKGPEFDHYDELLGGVFNKQLTLTNNCNRMSYQLEEVIGPSETGIITSAVQPGTVQLTPSGRLVVLMRDCQTTGGYARVLQLSDQAIHALAQRRPGSLVMFALTE